MTNDIFLLVGVPASGKSWVVERAALNYEVVHHDDYITNGGYMARIVNAAAQSNKPLLIETPFSMSLIMTPLIDRGFSVTPVFLIEDEDTLEERWDSRGTAPSARRGHMTRQNTYKARVGQYKAFCGTSSDVLNHLNLLAAQRGTND